MHGEIQILKVSLLTRELLLVYLSHLLLLKNFPRPSFLFQTLKIAHIFKNTLAPALVQPGQDKHTLR